MKKSKQKFPAVQWKKGETYPCPGKCGHRHVVRTGPCIEPGCGCQAKPKSKSKSKKGK